MIATKKKQQIQWTQTKIDYIYKKNLHKIDKKLKVVQLSI